MSESLQNFRFQLRSPTGGDVTVWQQGYGLDNAKWRVLQQYKGWVIQRVWPGYWNQDTNKRRCET